MTKRKIIALAIVSNALFIVAMSYMLFFKERLFDTSKQPIVDINSIERIEVGAGNWQWDGEQQNYENDRKPEITDKSDIIRFCKQLQSAHAKYIDNIRPTHWLNINFVKNGESKLSIVLKINYQKEVFIEYDNYTYDGAGIVRLLKELRVKSNSYNNI